MTDFFKNLYRDLRDRRLLAVAAVLLVAVIAVPVALSKSATPAPPPPVAAAPAHPSAAEAAVLTQQPGIRSYRKRLEQFKSKNPFRQHFKLPDEAASALEPAPANGGVVGGPAAEASSTPATSTSGTTTVTVPQTTSEPPELRYYTHTIDVNVGPQGAVERQDGVKQLSFLPDSSAPLIVFLGATVDGKKAVFLVSDDVASVTGDGACSPDVTNCRYLTLKPDQKVSVVNSVDTLTYSLRLISINAKRIRTVG